MTIDDQPHPVPNAGSPLWDLVIADMRERDQIGRQRYGTPLQAFNGRDALVDAYQEALDHAVYLRQAIEEREQPMQGLRAVLGELIESVRRWDLPHEGTTGYAADIDAWGDRLLKAAGFFRLQEQLRQRDRQLSICFTREALAAVLVGMNHTHWASVIGSPDMSDEGRMDFALREVDGWLELVRRGHVPGVPAQRAEDAGEQS